MRPSSGGRPAQKAMSVLIVVGVLLLLIVPALGRRFGWSAMAAYISLLGDLLIVASFVGHYFVFRANTYGGTTAGWSSRGNGHLDRAIRDRPAPHVRWVLVMCLGAELALGSLWGLLVVVGMQVPVLVWRILDEERLLERDLPGYDEYMHRVPCRLVPHVW